MLLLHSFLLLLLLLCSKVLAAKLAIIYKQHFSLTPATTTTTGGKRGRGRWRTNGISQRASWDHRTRTTGKLSEPLLDNCHSNNNNNLGNKYTHNNSNNNLSYNNNYNGHVFSAFLAPFLFLFCYKFIIKMSELKLIQKVWHDRERGEGGERWGAAHDNATPTRMPGLLPIRSSPNAQLALSFRQKFFHCVCVSVCVFVCVRVCCVFVCVSCGCRLCLFAYCIL